MRKKIIIIIIVGTIALAWVFLWHRDNGSNVPENTTVRGQGISVVTSFYPLYFLAQQIAGDKADVENITPSGAEPHDYDLTAQDIVNIDKSALLILNGGGLEAWGKNIGKNIDSRRTIIVTAGEGLTTDTAMEEGAAISDPHIWLSPVLAKKMAEKITEGLMRADPPNTAYYQSSSDVLESKLTDLDSMYRQGLSTCKEKNIITSHAAFGYLAKEYGLKQVSITGLSPDAEPSSQQLADIVKFAKENDVKYIFFESLVSPKLAETIADEVGATTLVLNPLEGLSEGEKAAGKDYFSVMRENLTHLKTALQCDE